MGGNGSGGSVWRRGAGWSEAVAMGQGRVGVQDVAGGAGAGQLVGSPCFVKRYWGSGLGRSSFEHGPNRRWMEAAKWWKPRTYIAPTGRSAVLGNIRSPDDGTIEMCLNATSASSRPGCQGWVRRNSGPGAQQVTSSARQGIPRASSRSLAQQQSSNSVQGLDTSFFGLAPVLLSSLANQVALSQHSSSPGRRQRWQPENSAPRQGSPCPIAQRHSVRNSLCGQAAELS